MQLVLGFSSTLRIAIVCAALAASVALIAGCGDSDDPEDGSARTGSAQSDGGADMGGSGGTGAGGDADSADSGGGTSTGGGRNGPTLSGDRAAALAGVDAANAIYAGFAAAAAAGVASGDVPVRDTLANAEGQESLTGVCDLMSEEARQQTVVYARRSAGLADVEWTCEKAVGLLLRRGGENGLSRTPRIVGVNAEGDRATATIRFGRKGRLSTVPLVKEDGEWKLGANPGSGGGQ